MAAFLLLWFGALAAIEVALGIAMLRGLFVPAFPGPSGWMVPMLAPAGLVAGGATLVAVGRHAAREEAARLLAFLADTLDAAPVPGPTPRGGSRR